jgi:hypothetical protein
MRLNTEILNKTKLSLSGARVEFTPIQKVESKPIKPHQSKEEEALSRMIAKNPHLLTLVKTFDLIPVKAGIYEDEVKTKQPKQTDKDKLMSLASEILDKETSYSSEDIINLINNKTNVGKERAERGFNLMVNNNILEEGSNRYYLQGSTPF